jgi:hypothetical protein
VRQRRVERSQPSDRTIQLLIEAIQSFEMNGHHVEQLPFIATAGWIDRESILNNYIICATET